MSTAVVAGQAGSRRQNGSRERADRKGARQKPRSKSSNTRSTSRRRLSNGGQTAGAGSAARFSAFTGTFAVASAICTSFLYLERGNAIWKPPNQTIAIGGVCSATSSRSGRKVNDRNLFHCQASPAEMLAVSQWAFCLRVRFRQQSASLARPFDPVRSLPVLWPMLLTQEVLGMSQSIKGRMPDEGRVGAGFDIRDVRIPPVRLPERCESPRRRAPLSHSRTAA